MFICFGLHNGSYYSSYPLFSPNIGASLAGGCKTLQLASVAISNIWWPSLICVVGAFRFYKQMTSSKKTELKGFDIVWLYLYIREVEVWSQDQVRSSKTLNVTWGFLFG